MLSEKADRFLQINDKHLSTNVIERKQKVKENS